MSPGALAHRHEGEAGHPAEALSRPCHEDIGAAIPGVDVHAAERGDGVDQQQRAALAHDPPDLPDRVERA